MTPGAPFLLVRARVKPEARDRFAAWYRDVHLRDVRQIPGITAITSGHTPAGTWLGFYSFTNADAIPAALNSPQAAYARGTWEQWAPEMEEMHVEMFAPLALMPLYHWHN